MVFELQNPELDWKRFYVRVEPIDSATASYDVEWTTDVVVVHGAVTRGGEVYGSPFEVRCVEQTEWDEVIIDIEDDDDVALYYGIAGGFARPTIGGSSGLAGGVNLGDFDQGQAKSADVAIPRPLRFVSGERPWIRLIEDDSGRLDVFGGDDVLDGVIDFLGRVIAPEGTSGGPRAYQSVTSSVDICYVGEVNESEGDYSPRCDGGQYSLRFNVSHGLQWLPPPD